MEENVLSMRHMNNKTEFYYENMKERGHLCDLGVDGNNLALLRQWCGLDRRGSVQGLLADSCEHTDLPHHCITLL
jgi:hypothetical protein